VRSPSDLLTIFRLPSPAALRLTRAAEIYERTLENVLREVAAGDKFNVTHSGVYYITIYDSFNQKLCNVCLVPAGFRDGLLSEKGF
jgi:hypothetical protein